MLIGASQKAIHPNTTLCLVTVDGDQITEPLKKIEVAKFPAITKSRGNGPGSFSSEWLNCQCQSRETEMLAGGLDNRRVALANRLGFVGFGLILAIVIVGLQELHRLRVMSQELKSAIRHADVERITSLVRAGADVRTRDRDDRSSLHVAASFGNEGLVRTLLKRGSDPNTRTKGGVTPLMAATPRGQLGVIALLVAAGADVDQRDENGQSAVFYAVMANRPDVVGQLTARYHARLDVTDNEGRTAILLARRCRFHQIVRLLKQQGVRE